VEGKILRHHLTLLLAAAWLAAAVVCLGDATQPDLLTAALPCPAACCWRYALLCLLLPLLQLAAVLVVADPAVQAALKSELPAICLLAKLDPAKVREGPLLTLFSG
jgi:hypothetical protein